MLGKISILATAAFLWGCSKPPPAEQQADPPVVSQATPPRPVDLAVDCTDAQITLPPSWSGDGNELAYVSDAGSMIYSRIDRTSRSLGGEKFLGIPRWSPVDTRIAAIVAVNTHDLDEDDEDAIAYGALMMTSARSTDPPVRLADNLSTNLAAQWSPDGKRILAMTITGTLVTVDSLTGDKKVIYAPRPDHDEDGLNGNAVWTSDHEIAFLTGDFRLRVVDADTSAVQAQWDNLRLFVASARPGEIWGSLFESNGEKLSVIRQGKVTKVSDTPVNTFDGPNAEGRIIAWNRQGVVLINARNGAVEQTTAYPGDNNPVWSPDGKTVAFLRDEADAGGQHYRLCFTNPSP